MPTSPDFRNCPGLFFHLVQDGHIAAAALAPLLAHLPSEQYVQTAVRGGEAFDSRRWPLAHDAALARFAFGRLGLPPGRVDEVLAAIDACGGDPDALRVLSRMAVARRLAAMGAGADVFSTIYRDSTPDELAAFAPGAAPASPPESELELEPIAALTAAHHAAADGLFAYHCHRGLPGPSAVPAAALVAAALHRGGMSDAELVAEALRVAGGAG